MRHIFISSIISVLTFSQAWAAPLTFDDKIGNSLQDIFVPAYQDLHSNISLLHQQTTKTCQSGASLQVASLKQSFAKALNAWEYIQSQHLGAVELQQRYTRLYFWPDKRGRLGKQLHKALTNKSQDLLSASTLARKSVALQGFNALERLLYKDNSAYDQKFLCQYATAITENMTQISQEIVENWQNSPQSPIAEMADLRAGTSLTYDSPKDILQEVYRDIITNLILIRDYKLAPMIVKKDQKLKWQRSEFWLSQLGFASIQANLKFIEDVNFGVSDKTGFAQFIENDKAKQVLRDKTAEAQQAIAQLQNLKVTRQAITEPQNQEKLKLAQTKIRHLQESVIEHLLPYLNIDLGFNALDGD